MVIIKCFHWLAYVHTIASSNITLPQERVKSLTPQKTIKKKNQPLTGPFIYSNYTENQGNTLHHCLSQEPVWRSENNTGVNQVPELFILPLPAHCIIKATAVSAQECQSLLQVVFWKAIQSALSHQYSSCDTYRGLCFITWNGHCFAVTPPYVCCCSCLFPAVKIGQCITANLLSSLWLVHIWGKVHHKTGRETQNYQILKILNQTVQVYM